jgi:hypothetical protein
MSLAEYLERDLLNMWGLQFYGEVNLGSPNQRIHMMFDTGSPNAWVYSLKGCKEFNNE